MPQPLQYDWPLHWQSSDGAIQCVVLGCFFKTHATSVVDQWRDLRDHCKNQIGWEHHVLWHMLRQTRCVHHGCSHQSHRQPWMVRELFDHETSTHNGATIMSRIESFVTLVRQGRVNMTDLDEVKEAIFERMVDKIYLTGNTIILIFRMAGLPHHTDQTTANLRGILSLPALQQGGPQASLWEPVPPRLFLTNIAPRVGAPVNDLWRVLWTRLRIMYAEGRI